MKVVRVKEALSPQILFLIGSSWCRSLWSFCRKRRLTAKKCYMNHNLNGQIFLMTLSEIVKSSSWQWSKQVWLNTNYSKTKMWGILKISKWEFINMTCFWKIILKSLMLKDLVFKIKILELYRTIKSKDRLCIISSHLNISRI